MLADKQGRLLTSYVSDYVVFDLETTGISCGTDDIVEISAISVKDSIPVDEFSTLVNPLRPIPYYASRVNGITDEMVADSPVFEDVLPKFLEFIGDAPVVAHNGADFDFPFMNHELEMLGLPQIPRTQQMDTLVIARNRVFGLKSYTLDALAKWFGISLTARADAHGALIDSEILAKVYLELENTAPAPEISDIVAKQHEAF